MIARDAHKPGPTETCGHGSMREIRQGVYKLRWNESTLSRSKIIYGQATDARKALAEIWEARRQALQELKTELNAVSIDEAFAMLNPGGSLAAYRELIKRRKVLPIALNEAQQKTFDAARDRGLPPKWYSLTKLKAADKATSRPLSKVSIRQRVAGAPFNVQFYNPGRAEWVCHGLNTCDRTAALRLACDIKSLQESFAGELSAKRQKDAIDAFKKFFRGAASGPARSKGHGFMG